MFPLRMKEKDPNDRRRAGRLRCEQARCQFGPVQEMSRTGLRCITRKPLKLPEGQCTHLRITCAGRESVVAARPVHSHKRPDGTFETGFLFVGLSEQHATELVSLARTAASTDGCMHRPKML